LAIDCETMGLNPKRDRLCVVQLSNGNGDAHLVQFNENFDAPNLKKLLSNPKTEKIFHFGRFDLAAIQEYLGLEISSPVYCTKIASKLARTYTDRHGLKDVCKELIMVVEVVGAPVGDDSSISGSTKDISAASTKVELSRRTTPMSGISNRLV
jgi:ribonuclease D